MERRRVRREAYGDRELVSVGMVMTTRRGPKAHIVARVEPSMPGVTYYRRVSLVADAPGWIVDGDTRLRNLDDVLTFLAGYGLGAIRAQAERWEAAHA